MSKSPAELTIELEELAIKYEEQKLNFADFKETSEMIEKELEAQLKLAQDERAGLEEKLALIKTQKDSEISALQLQYDTAYKKLSEQSSGFEAVKKKLMKVEIDFDELSNLSRIQAIQIEQLTAENEDLKEKLALLEMEHETDNEQLRAQIDDMRHEILENQETRVAKLDILEALIQGQEDKKEHGQVCISKNNVLSGSFEVIQSLIEPDIVRKPRGAVTSKLSKTIQFDMGSSDHKEITTLETSTDAPKPSKNSGFPNDRKEMMRINILDRYRKSNPSFLQKKAAPSSYFVQDAVFNLKRGSQATQSRKIAGSANQSVTDKNGRKKTRIGSASEIETSKNPLQQVLRASGILQNKTTQRHAFNTNSSLNNSVEYSKQVKSILDGPKRNIAILYPAEENQAEQERSQANSQCSYSQKLKEGSLRFSVNFANYPRLNTEKTEKKDTHVNRKNDLPKNQDKLREKLEVLKKDIAEKRIEARFGKNKKQKLRSPSQGSTKNGGKLKNHKFNNTKTQTESTKDHQLVSTQRNAFKAWRSHLHYTFSS